MKSFVDFDVSDVDRKTVVATAHSVTGTSEKLCLFNRIVLSSDKLTILTYPLKFWHIIIGRTHIQDIIGKTTRARTCIFNSCKYKFFRKKSIPIFYVNATSDMIKINDGFRSILNEPIIPIFFKLLFSKMNQSPYFYLVKQI